nr:AbiV family abortive infection protein [Streptomyces sp. SID13031]
MISAAFARRWWFALMANAVGLIEDAAVLAGHGSPGRAQSLVVLAMEELAKARWLYTAASAQWTSPLGLYGLPPREAGPVIVPEGLRSTRRPHLEKLRVAEQFASGLGGFWDPERRPEYYFPADLETFDTAARQRNTDKQAGLYVDRAGDVLATPLAIPPGPVADMIEQAAQTIEMQLIEDHTRQQDAPEGAPVDSFQDLHWVILPYAHPEMHADFVDRLSAADRESGQRPTRSDDS